MHDEIILRLAHTFQHHGKELYLVGGTVRDEILGRPCHDIDCTTNALPDEIKMIAAETEPKHIVPIGEKFGTIQLIYEDDATIEVTTYRGERYEQGSRKPTVEFGTSLYDDLRRRDFTINAIAKNPLTGYYVDPYLGRKDLNIGVIRAVDDPAQRFTDDPLRLLRAVRFATQLSFIISGPTEMAMMQQAREIQNISQERIRDELCKILLNERVYCGFDWLDHVGLLSLVLPEVQSLIGVTQPPHHSLDVFDHTMTVVQMVPTRLPLRWAALLHDIAKPATKTIDEQGNAHFYQHEDIGADTVQGILTRLRFSSDFIERVVRLVRMHMRVNQYTEKWSNASVRRLFVDAGDVFDDLLDLAIADGASDRHESLDTVKARIDHLRERVAHVRVEARQHHMTCPLNGEELMALFDRDPGPWLAPIKKHLQDMVIEGTLRFDDKQGAIEAAKAFEVRG